MPVKTRSQTWSGQPPDQVTSPRVDLPRRLADSRQDNAVVSEIANAGSPFISISVANGDQHAASFDIIKCHSGRCLTCPKLSTSKSFQSNITHQTFDVINHSSENLNCHSQNLIYLLSCNRCNIQYVGETTIPLHKRINIHRTSKTGCEHNIKHFKEHCVGASFNVQILEIFQGTGYTNNKVDPTHRKIRLDREEYWMKKLRTIYPYGLNERARDTNNNIPVGKMFPSIPRARERVVRSRRNRNNHATNTSVPQFFDNLSTILQTDIKRTYYLLRVILNNTKKKILKGIATYIIQKFNSSNYDTKMEQILAYILDSIDTKLYYPYSKTAKNLPPKYTCLVEFHNKAVEAINLASIFRKHEVIHLLPSDMREKDNLPMVTYKLCSTIRNRIFNYKQTVNDIFINEDIDLGPYINSCSCNNSTFCDPHHEHIVTGDLRIVKNNKLRKLLTKGPNFREPRTFNLKIAQEKIKSAINECISNMANKSGYPEQTFYSWKNKVLEEVKSKTELLKKRYKPFKTSQVLQDPEVQTYIEQLHRDFVIVPIDKASNNFAFICKYFYITKILQEVGINSAPCQTYRVVEDTKENIISNNKKFCNKFDLQVVQDFQSLPIMYWMPKLHKNPIGSRFIIASKKCSTKPLSTVISRVFKMIFAHVESFHKKSHFYSSFKKFWVVQNSFPVLKKLDQINMKKNAKSLYTFDFSTLYTTIPHKLLIKVLSDIIKLVFKSNSFERIGFSESSVYWTTKGVGKRTFTQQSLTDSVSFLIENCYFTIGNLVLKQDIGIPMGIDPAPFWANLFLYHFESKYIQLLISEGSNRAFKYHATSRFIDDLIAINDGKEFYQSFKKIYPSQLELKLEHHGSHATFLDLDITIREGVFVYKLFDKRDAFPFHVVRMPHGSSNIPSTIFQGSIFSEFLRVARCTLFYEDFLPRAWELFQRMINQGGNSKVIFRQIRKAIRRYPAAFEKFDKTFEDISIEIQQYRL